MEIDIKTGYIKIVYSRGKKFRPDLFTWEVGVGSDSIQLIKV